MLSISLNASDGHFPLRMLIYAQTNLIIVKIKSCVEMLEKGIAHYVNLFVFATKFVFV